MFTIRSISLTQAIKTQQEILNFTLFCVSHLVSFLQLFTAEQPSLNISQKWRDIIVLLKMLHEIR